MPSSPMWPVIWDHRAFTHDYNAASTTAREHLRAWRTRIETGGGIPGNELRRCRDNDNAGLDLPRCVKVRIPLPHEEDPRRSPWGAVLKVQVDLADSVTLLFLAFGLRHPPADSKQPSVYDRAHRRLNPPT